MLPDVRPCGFLCVIIKRKLDQEIRVVGMSHFIYILAHVWRYGRWIETVNFEFCAKPDFNSVGTLSSFLRNNTAEACS
jgi:hypothetical protein